MKASVGSPQGRQVPKGRVLWEQQAGGGVRQVTALKEILDLGTQGQAWVERGPLRPCPGGGPRLMRQNGEGWREERKERHTGPLGGAREAWSRKAGGAGQVGGPGLGRPPTAGQSRWMGVRRGPRKRNEQPWQKGLGREVSSSGGQERFPTSRASARHQRTDWLSGRCSALPLPPLGAPPQARPPAHVGRCWGEKPERPRPQ